MQGNYNQGMNNSGDYNNGGWYDLTCCSYYAKMYGVFQSRPSQAQCMACTSRNLGVHHSTCAGLYNNGTGNLGTYNQGVNNTGNFNQGNVNAGSYNQGEIVLAHI